MARETALKTQNADTKKALEERDKNLNLALSSITKQFGEGSVMRLGSQSRMNVEAVSTGSLAVDLALGIGVAHEVEALLPVAVLHREADAVEREPDAPPGAVERLVHLQALGAVVGLDDVGALLRRGHGGERETEKGR